MKHRILMPLGLLLALPVRAAGDTPAGLLNWLVSCFLVIGLIVALGWLLKKSRLTQRLGHPQLRVITSLPVGYKERLLVVQVGERQLLLGMTAQQITLLHQLEQPLSEPPMTPFAQQLGKMMRKNEGN